MSNLTGREQFLLRVATKSHSCQKGEAGPSDESLELSGRICHSGGRKNGGLSVSGEVVKCRQPSPPGDGVTGGLLEGTWRGVLPPGRCGRPRLHQAALTLSKLRVHDCRGGALEKGVVLVRKARVTCQRREEGAGLRGRAARVGGGRLALPWACPPRRGWEARLCGGPGATHVIPLGL